MVACPQAGHGRRSGQSLLQLDDRRRWLRIESFHQGRRLKTTKAALHQGAMEAKACGSLEFTAIGLAGTSDRYRRRRQGILERVAMVRSTSTRSSTISRALIAIAALLSTQLLLAPSAWAAPAEEQQPAAAARKPNILVIWGDDIGVHNISAYSMGVMGYKTPNIDRIAREGAIFTDAYAQQSCTAGRASFILGQHPFRTGLLTIGMPGSEHGIPDWTPTIADLLKAQGYTTGQFGMNHLGDRDKHLPTAHGFDEFFGNLYHLNAEEEPETYYYPKDPAFRKQYGPRGVLHSYGDGRIQDTGPLNRARMPTIDQEIQAAAVKFIDNAVQQKKPFFVWFNTTRMHVWTHLKKESDGVTGVGLYPDGMVEHDKMIGEMRSEERRVGKEW